MIRKCRMLLAFMLVITSMNAALAQDNAYKTELEAMFQGFKTKRYELMKPLLTPHTKIGSLPRGMNDEVVPQVINQLPEPSTYRVDKIIREKGGTRVSMTYNYTNGMARPVSFVFDDNKKITDLDILSGTQTITDAQK